MASDWPWGDSLDALVAAPGPHRLVFENAHVRVLDTRMAPGERSSHPAHCSKAAASQLSSSAR